MRPPAGSTSLRPGRLSVAGFLGGVPPNVPLPRFEIEFPFQDTKVLIGAQDLEFAVGTGFIRGYR
jgi:hypothetical protein